MADPGDNHPHLQLLREEPVTERRPGRGFGLKTSREDPRSHGTALSSELSAARQAASDDLGGYDGRSLIKLRLAEKVLPENISSAVSGFEVVSQEEGTLILAFADEAQLDDFEAKLTNLAEGRSVTYQNIIYALDGLDHWRPEDRTGWALGREGFPDGDSILLDAELWPLARGNESDRLRRAFEQWAKERGGEIVDAVRQPYLTIFRLRCPQQLARELLRHRDVRTLDLPPRLGMETSLVFTPIQELDDVPSPPDQAPGIVVLDSGLAAGHPVLAPAVGDSQSFVAGASPADQHGHGTFVAGIALYDDVAACLQNRRFEPKLRLFSGRILNDQSAADPLLIENQVGQAVRYFREEYGCRVFNLSYGDLNKPYQGRHVSGLAVTLDALSRELDVLFVVPTGNFKGDEEGPSDWRGEYPCYLSAPGATLIDPAPALNALTVGSLARNELNPRWPGDPAYQPVARTDQPSPFTRHGPSVNDAIKPDLVDYGGNWMIDARTDGGLAAGRQGLGELSTNSSFATQNPFREDSGTSFSAPRVAHAAARILGEIPEVGVDLCRALLVAHASTPQACRDLLADDGTIRNVTGYGLVDRSALYRSVEDCVTLWARESIEDRRHHFYEIPVPDEFWQGGRRNREITVSLAYRPPVRTTRIDYRAAGISFKLVQAESLNAVARRFNAAVARDSVEDISERDAGRRFTEQARSRGTVQASTWRFKQPSPSVRGSSWFVVVTRNDPAWGANLVREREPYALAVTLADRLAEQSRLHTLVEARLRTQLRARQTASRSRPNPGTR